MIDTNEYMKNAGGLSPLTKWLIKENEQLQESNDHLQGLYQDEHCTVLELKRVLQEIKEIIENNCWDYTDVTVLGVKEQILQKIAEVENG